jgi:hypothetical protein
MNIDDGGDPTIQKYGSNWKCGIKRVAGQGDFGFWARDFGAGFRPASGP